MAGRNPPRYYQLSENFQCTLNINKSFKRTKLFFSCLVVRQQKKVCQFLLTIIQMYKIKSVRTNEAGFFKTKIPQRVFDGNSMPILFRICTSVLPSKGNWQIWMWERVKWETASVIGEAMLPKILSCLKKLLPSFFYSQLILFRHADAFSEPEKTAWSKCSAWCVMHRYVKAKSLFKLLFSKV